MSGLRLVVRCALVLVLSGGFAGSLMAAEKQPPSCAAISFRALPMGMQEGVQDAGLYRSRFGKLVLRAEVSGGQAHNYYLEVNGKRPPPIKGEVPASLNPCLNAKHVKTPAPSAGPACIGERFRVVIDHSGKEEYVILFGLQGDIWKLCSASLI